MLDTGSGANEVRYGFTGSGDTPDVLLNSSNQVTERYLQLPGGTLLTKRGSGDVFSLANVHGDVMATTDSSGTQTGTFTYDPFGNPVSGSPSNTATDSTYGWVGQHEKATETAFTLAPTQMGARVYLARAGRFLSVDPVEGGVENSYVYPPDPVNKMDLDGEAAFLILPAIMLAIRVAPYVPRAYTFARHFISTSRRGMAAHRHFSGAVNRMGGAGNRTLLGSRYRPDGVLGKRIMELKPHNTRAIARGYYQLNKYRGVAGSRYRYELWTYKRTWYGRYKYRCHNGCR